MEELNFNQMTDKAFKEKYLSLITERKRSLKPERMGNIEKSDELLQKNDEVLKKWKMQHQMKIHKKSVQL